MEPVERISPMTDGLSAPGSLDARLCSMPFAPLVPPSLALGLLQAAAKREGAQVASTYFSLTFAKAIGVETYDTISTRLLRYGIHEAGQWMFSGALFTGRGLDPDEYVERILRQTSMPYRPVAFPESLIETVLRARAEVDAFLERAVGEALDRSPKVIAFTCSYSQRIPSLALAKRIKAQSPGTFVVLGGPDCEGVMGAQIISSFDFVDAVVSGTGEAAFVEILERVREGAPVGGIPGVCAQNTADALCRGNGVPSAPREASIDALPFPDYDDYFRQIEESGLALAGRPYVSLETARGCWWAERKSRCTFCAENLRDVVFRSKSQDRALAELSAITERYRPSFINMIDRTLDTAYFTHVMPSLACRPLGTTILCSVRPTLTKDQLRALRDAGVTSIGAGIESLSTPVLKLMRKGSTALHNIQLLKWARELGLHVLWNVLWGFPGEPAEEYGRMARLIPRLSHLTPPKIGTQVVLMRFAPLFDDAEAFGLTALAPAPVYEFLYPLDPPAIANLAYYFSYRYRTPRDVDVYTADLKLALEEWRQVHDRSQLLVMDEGDSAVVHDERPEAPQRLARLTGLDRALLLACEGQQSEAQLQRAVAAEHGTVVGLPELQDTLRRLQERWLVISDGSRWLSLGVRVPEDAGKEPAEARR
jgi:ribosomal peptide maturation radical SAM protein 1